MTRLRHAADGRLELSVRRVPAEGGSGARRPDRHRRPNARPALPDGGQPRRRQRARRCARCSRCWSGRRTAPGARRSSGTSPTGGRCSRRDAMQSTPIPINPQRVFWELSPRLPDRRILTARLRVGGQLVRARSARSARGMMASLSGTLATMGPRRAVRDRAKFAFPDRPVIALVGDGAMQMNGINGLITIAQVLEGVDRPAPDRPGAQQRRPEPGDLGAAGDGGRPASFEASQDLPGLPLRALRRVARAAGASASTARRMSAPAWDAGVRGAIGPSSSRRSPTPTCRRFRRTSPWNRRGA